MKKDLNEYLQMCSQSMEFCRRDLAYALSASSAVEGIVVMRLIEQAAKLDNEIRALHEAVRSDSKVTA